MRALVQGIGLPFCTQDPSVAHKHLCQREFQRALPQDDMVEDQGFSTPSGARHQNHPTVSRCGLAGFAGSVGAKPIRSR
jgi:hypothetical protein